MIELLLVADRLLAAGDLERAERIYLQVAEADPRNAIAVVGLAHVAHARGLSADAADFLWRALDIDPQDQAAQRLVMDWANERTASHEPLAEPGVADMPAAASPDALAPTPADAAPPAAPAPTPGPSAPPAAPTPAPPGPAAPPPSPKVAPRASLLARIRAWLGLTG